MTFRKINAIAFNHVTMWKRHGPGFLQWAYRNMARLI